MTLAPITLHDILTYAREAIRNERNLSYEQLTGEDHEWYTFQLGYLDNMIMSVEHTENQSATKAQQAEAKSQKGTSNVHQQL